MKLPVDNGILTQSFQQHKNHQPQGSWGTDIGFNTSFLGDVPVYACYKSVVTNHGLSATFGNRIWVKNLEGRFANFFIVYPHLRVINSEILKMKIIEEGTLLGYMGNSGLIYNPLTRKIEANNDGHIHLPYGRHLHLECRTDMSNGLTSIFLDEIEKEYLK
jgi:hypothetical protein